jgi:serine phosphatase RsbU (regulator of sigma subunit)
MLIELLGAFPLRLRGMVLLCLTIVVEVVFIDLAGLVDVDIGDQVVLGISIVALVAFTAHRDRLGLQGAPSDLMIVDLRDRLAVHGRIPQLPAGWRVDTAMRSANAEAFSGDFIVAARSAGGSLLEVVLVDVSGKGQGAGVRSLQLSGAFGGLLGSMPREQFLTVANDYLLERSWDEGFATAIHLAVDLVTGRYWVASAGHPPALHRHAGSGLLEIIDTIGAPALGIVADLPRVERSGQLEHGDALMIYTDGVVEVPGYDLELGIDRLMGATERVVGTGRGGAEAVLAAVRAGEGDDRGLVLVHRD